MQEVFGFDELTVENEPLAADDASDAVLDSLFHLKHLAVPSRDVSASSFDPPSAFAVLLLKARFVTEVGRITG